MTVYEITQTLPDSQSSQHSQAPEPLRRPVPPPLPFPVDALGTVLGGAANAIHRVVRSPLAMAGNAVLSAAALAAQGHRDVVVDGRRSPLSLFLLTVGASGERKDGTDRPALAAHREVERQWIAEWSAEMIDYRAADLAYQAAARSAGSGRDAEARRQALKDLGPPPDAPLLPHLMVAEPTIEGLHKLLQGGRGTLGLFSGEGGQFTGGHAMQKEHVARTAAALSGLWDCGEFDRIRAGDGASKTFGKRLSLHLMLQPVLAERVLADPVLSGQGLLARCLVAWPDSTVGGRLYVEQDITTDPGMVRYWRTCRELLLAPMPVQNRNELAPPAFTLTPEAKRIWVLLHDAIERRMAPEGEFALIRPAASKAPQQIARVAGVLAVFEGAGSIEADHIDRAGALLEFFLSEAVRLVGTAEVSPEVRRAEAVLAWAQERHKRFICSAELVRLGPSCIRERRHLTAAMDELERAGWAQRIEGGMDIDGQHRRTVWRIAEGAS